MKRVTLFLKVFLYVFLFSNKCYKLLEVKEKEWKKLENSNWFNKKVQDVEKELNTNVKKGLTEEEVLARREKYGLNALKAKKKNN